MMKKYNAIHTTAKWPQMQSLYAMKIKSKSDTWPFYQQTDQHGKLTDNYQIVQGERKSIKKERGNTYILCIFTDKAKHHLQWVRLNKILDDLRAAGNEALANTILATH